MGEVFLVVHEEISRELVAKLLHKRLAGDRQLLERVRLEAQSLARLHDPNIVEVTDFRVTRDGRPFLVMERLVGRTVKEELAARQALSIPDALDFVHQGLSALTAAHALGIIHRDIKPENLFLCEELDKSITLKVLDFGIARVIPGISGDAPQPLALPTETGAVLGTPRYLSPEAALGKRVDHRADLYALALVFYEMVAGRGPFDHMARDYLSAHTLEDPEPPSTYAKQPVPAEIDAAILHGLQKNPGERYQSAEEFAHEIERLWTLVQNSQALETTVFSHEEVRNRTAGLRIRRDALTSRSTAPFVQLGDPDSSDNANSGGLVERDADSGNGAVAQAAPPRRTTRPALMVASILVALVTAIGITSLVAFFLSRTGP